MGDSNLSLLWKVLQRRRVLERSNRWTREGLAAHQQASVSELRRFAMERSPFYARFHRGMEGKPLTELPVLTKPMMMENFDDLVTDRAVRLADVEAYLTACDGAGLFRERYVTLATSGTTGQRGVFLFDPQEWLTALASISRPLEWAERHYNWFRPTRVAMIAANSPSHYSGRIGSELSNALMPSLRLEASEPMKVLVEKLNEWQPVMLATFPSVLRALAEEQLAGRLRIKLRQVTTSAESLTEEVRRRVREAWNAKVYNTYGATEYSPIAAECRHGRLHLMEDGALIEVADENGPVPMGVQGNRILLTVFDRRTQPLIRYELSDVVRAIEGRCECGRPFQMIEAVEGRREEVLVLQAPDGTPVWFHQVALQQVIETVPSAGWQVIEREAGLSVHLIGVRDRAAMEQLAPKVSAMLEAHGAAPVAVEVREVEKLQRGRTGKALMILRRERAQGA